MEAKTNSKISKQSVESNSSLILPHGGGDSKYEKGSRKSKKDRLKDKRKYKGQPKADTSCSNHENELVILNFEKPFLQTSLIRIQTSSETTKESIQQKKIEHRASYPLQNILKKPSYLSISGGNRIVGHFGHSTSFFKRPVLEGHFFMEFAFIEDNIKMNKLKNKPSVRFGVCNYKFNSSFPLGWEDSVGYKSSDGTIFHEGQLVYKGQEYKIGDLIGVSLKMSPPYKHPDANQVSEGSSVSFYKNGELIFCFQRLKQTFYCFAISTYNYSQAQVVSLHSKYQVYEEAGHYFNSLGEQIRYKDLQDSGIFKI